MALTVTRPLPGHCRPGNAHPTRSPFHAALVAAGVALAIAVAFPSLAHAGPAKAPAGHEAAHPADHEHDIGHDTGQPARTEHEQVPTQDEHDAGNRAADAPSPGQSHSAEEGHASHDGGASGARVVPPAWASRDNPLPLDPATLAAGEQVFQRFCSTCHGPTGRGDGQAPAVATFDPSPANLALHGPGHDAGEYAWVIHEGNAASAMPRFAEKLNEKEIWSVVHYIRHGLAHDQQERDSRAHDH
ncbi:c-type cytochrome [Billgrantia lactosivorans]|uniref:c-type cytochrome n=1 Tax=Billgrantia lactosivorans TaxID=2185141 RepID=UPI000DAE170C|nr:c-type cytochrome [Halomonas lactosivorans]